MARKQHRQRCHLADLAKLAMLERGFVPDYSVEVLDEVRRLEGPAHDESARDMRDMLWCSIDNDDSLDLDQLSASEQRGDGTTRLWIAIADVDALVPKDGAIDRRARNNTTSVYTPGHVFAMLPEQLSTDLTSLNPGVERLAVVTGFDVDGDGIISEPTIERARVLNHAKLAYDSVGAWLEDRGPAPPAMLAVDGLPESLRAQDAAAQRLRARRLEHGALVLETIQVRARFDQEEIQSLEQQHRDRAKELIEDLMVATNGVTSRFLRARKQPTLRRVIQSPERWQRLVDLAAELRFDLPEAPDSIALGKFLAARQLADPLRFPDLSLSVVKLLGRGEYAVAPANVDGPGHFGLAVRDYTHSTAPNRRYPDLITQRQLKAVIAGRSSPYTIDELTALARRCTDKENDADKVERLATKSAAACFLEDRVGQKFDALVTGASQKGTWVRIFEPPVEGKLVRGWKGLDVGDRVRVKLVDTNVERGFIDFTRA